MTATFAIKLEKPSPSLVDTGEVCSLLRLRGGHYPNPNPTPEHMHSKNQVSRLKEMMEERVGEGGMIKLTDVRLTLEEDSF